VLILQPDAMWYVLSRSLLLPAVNLIRQSLCADLVLAFGFYFQARRSDRAAQGLRYGCCVRYPCRSSRFWTLQLPRTPSTIPAPTLRFAHLLAQPLIFLPLSFPPSLSHQFIITQPHSPFCEYIANSPDGHTIQPVFGDLFLNEPIPEGGKIDVSDEPGFGLILNPKATLIPYSKLFNADPEDLAGKTDQAV
jgi:hypothetical protein